VWLGHGTDVASVRPYRFGDLWAMVARSAYTQLRHSPALLAGTVVGLVMLFAVPPAAAVWGVISLAGGGSVPGALACGCGLAAWLAVAVTYVPTLRMYGLGGLRAAALPAVALLYAGMTVDSARRHRHGVGGAWKGRTSSPSSRA
jgi:hypothetical protein